MKKSVPCLLIVSVALTGCATPNGPNSTTGQNGSNSTTGRTMAEGAGVGALLGAALGAALGGRDGALLGAALGGGVGLAAGGYVAQQKAKYATIEERMAGERELAAQATATARSQTIASKAQLQLANAELADLRAQGASREEAQKAASDMLASLQDQRTKLEAEKKTLETTIGDQTEFIAETEKEIGSSDPEKTAQLAQWQAEIPNMQAAVFAMSDQIASLSAAETEVQDVASACC